MMGTRLTAAILAFAALCVPIHASALNKEQLGCAARLVDPGDVSTSYEAMLQAQIKRTRPPRPVAIRSAVASCAEMHGLSKEQEQEYYMFALSDLFAAQARMDLLEAGFAMDALDKALEIGEGLLNPLPAQYSETQWQAYEAALSTWSGNSETQRQVEVTFGLYITMSHSSEQQRRKLS